MGRRSPASPVPPAVDRRPGHRTAEHRLPPRRSVESSPLQPEAVVPPTRIAPRRGRCTRRSPDPRGSSMYQVACRTSPDRSQQQAPSQGPTDRLPPAAPLSWTDAAVPHPTAPRGPVGPDHRLASAPTCLSWTFTRPDRGLPQPSLARRNAVRSFRPPSCAWHLERDDELTGAQAVLSARCGLWHAPRGVANAGVLLCGDASATVHRRLARRNTVPDGSDLRS